MTTGRWEWRRFGPGAEQAESHLVGRAPNSVEESDETYLLSATSAASVKVRDGLLDVKRLVHVSDEGLEQWMPLAKDPFPVTAATLGAALAELGLEISLIREAYTLAALLDDVVAPCPDLHALAVHKTRRRLTLSGCMAELTDAHAAGRTARTVAVESEDHDLVLATLSRLGLRPRPNVSVPLGLKRLLDIGPRRNAVIDVGTSSVKFHLAERSEDGSWRPLVDRAVVTRLGEGLRDTGELQPAPAERTLAAIAGMVDEAQAAEVEEIVAVGTAGLRAATNSAQFVESVATRCGVHIDVISGDEEARLAFLAATAGLERVEGSLVVFETGGGSTQLTFGHDGRIDEQFSVPVGAVRYTEQFGLDRAVDEATLAAAFRSIAADLSSLDDRPTPSALVALGGAVTNLAAVSHGLATYDAEVVQGSVLDVEEIDRLIERFRTHEAEERRTIVGLQPARAEVILAGALVVRTVLAKLGRDAFTVSDRGLRHRLLVERFGRG